MGIRSKKVQGQLKREISRIVQEDLKDPRIGFVTVTRIELTGDIRFARVYFSILGDEANQETSMSGLQNAAGFIRRLIGERLRLKYVPELSFKHDKSIEYSINLEKIFERLRNEQRGG